jgi:OmpA-OmpF porin, OOP family
MTAARLLALLLALAGAVPAAAAAQRSAEAYVCQLSGRCGPARPTGDAVRQAMQNGFRLGEDGDAAPPPPRVERRAALSVGFRSGSATLAPGAEADLRVIAAALTDRRLAGRRFRIEGHTDASGSAARNLWLSQARATTVATRLAALGVDRRRLQAVGYGSARPLPGVPRTAAANRRVEAVALP